jgi:hypothetical protein
MYTYYTEGYVCKKVTIHQIYLKNKQKEKKKQDVTPFATPVSLAGLKFPKLIAPRMNCKKVCGGRMKDKLTFLYSRDKTLEVLIYILETSSQVKLTKPI